MKSNKYIANIAKRIRRKQQGIREQNIIHPVRDWWAGITLAVLLFLGSAWWSAQSYVTYSEASVASTIAADDEVVVYRESLVEAALEQFSDRTATFRSLQTSPPPVPPPPPLALPIVPTATSIDEFINPPATGTPEQVPPEIEAIEPEDSSNPPDQDPELSF